MSTTLDPETAGAPRTTDTASPRGRTARRHGTRARLRRAGVLGIPHTFLVLYSLVSVLPIVLIVMNSFKRQRDIFGSPLALPTAESFSLDGYATLLERGDFPRYFLNSFLVTGASLAIILVFGAMIAFVLAQHRFPGDKVLGFVLALGLMVPIRLASLGILALIQRLGLVDTILALVLVYAAQGLPIAFLILQQFYRSLPSSLMDAARLDGASEFRIFLLLSPLVRPALASVAVFVMIPIWNDIWFPLILASSEENRTVILGVQRFFGQFQTNWNAVLAALSVAMLPLLGLYLVFSRWIISGLTDGANK